MRVKKNSEVSLNEEGNLNGWRKTVVSRKGIQVEGKKKNRKKKNKRWKRKDTDTTLLKKPKP